MSNPFSVQDFKGPGSLGKSDLGVPEQYKGKNQIVTEKVLINRS